MKKVLKKVWKIINNRYIVLSFITILVAIIYIFQLFNIQIINGKTYREKSQSRTLRTENVVATRGEIYDRNGVVLASSKLSFDVNIYKVKVSVSEANDSIARFIKILESNGDKIYSTFPVNDSLNGFNFENNDSESYWKEQMKIDKSFDFNKTIDYYIDLYALQDFSNDRNLQIKMIEVKYEANLNSYSLFNGVTVAKDISDKSVAQIKESKYELYGISIASVSKRYYPYSTLLSHVLGYVSKVNSTEYSTLKDQGYSINSVVGKSGIEQSFEKYLKGVDGKKSIETDNKGNVTSESIVSNAVAGNNVTLTIDYRLQKTSEDALVNTIDRLKNGTLNGKKIPDASAGAVVVLDVKTGGVLAMASYPTYDINQFVDGISQNNWLNLVNDPLRPMYNRAISGTYSPGSTYKMLVATAGLETGAITPTEKILDTGVYQYGYHPKCWIYTQYGLTHGYVDVSGAIKVSCNCFFYEVGRRVGIADIVKYAKLFGLGQKTGIELSQEASGQIAGDNPNIDWYLGDTLSAAIGQSYNSYTPLQLANYISTIANGGTLNKVSVIKSINNEITKSSVSNDEIEEYSKEYTGVDFKSQNLAIKSEYIDAIKKGMLSVTSETGGTSYILFKNSSIQVAGKTGTSQVASGSNNGIFVGFAPYDDPQIAVVAVIEHGGEGTYTANVVKPIMEEYFNISTEDAANQKNQNTVESKVSF
jgi:penicillin-binding protein 2